MRILGLDPSSACTGACVIEGSAAKPALVAGELLRPRKRTDGYLARVDEICKALVEVIREYEPDVAVIEVPDLTHHGEPRSGGAMATYGYAVGRIEGVCHANDLRVIRRGVDEATRRLPKRARQMIVAGAVRGYDPLKDRGMDLSDAIYLALTELTRQECGT